MSTYPTVLILNDIRSVHNVGSIMRTADAGGIAHIYFTGYTPNPLDRFGRNRNDIAKTALGAEKVIAWSAESDIQPLLQKLKGDGFQIIAIEQSARSIPYHTYSQTNPVALILGNEVGGTPQAVLDQCDAVLEIAMHGKKESLNVGVAFGIVLFSLINHK